MLLSEENSTVCDLLAANAAFQQLLSALMQSAQLSPHVRVLAAGVAFHTLKYSSAAAAPSNAAATSAAMRGVVATLIGALDIDPVAGAAELRTQTAAVEAQIEQTLAARTAAAAALHGGGGDDAGDADGDDGGDASMAAAMAAVDAATAGGALALTGNEASVAAASSSSSSSFPAEAMEDTAPEDVHAPPTDANVLSEAAMDAEPWTQPLAAWRQRALAVRTAVELLANVCSLDEARDGDDELNDAGWDADGQDGDDGGAAAGSSSSSSGAADEASSAPESFRLALEAGVLDRLLARCAPPPLSMHAAFVGDELHLPVRVADEAVALAYACSERALTALNNIVLLLPAAVLGDVTAVWARALAFAADAQAAHDAWPAESAAALPSATDVDALVEVDAAAAGTAGSNAGLPPAVSVLNACSDLVWSLLRKRSAALGVTKAHIGVLVNWARGGKTAALRLHAVGALSLIAASRAHDDFVLVFGSVFVQLLGDAALPVVAETVNAIFDLFSEDGQYTAAIQQLNLLPQLSAFLPVLTQRVRSCRFVAIVAGVLM